jgi:hypothetical protein
VIHIDLSRAPTIDKGHVFLQLDRATANTIAAWPEIDHRLDNALRFACMISGDHEQRFRCALIRATLTELVSVEDVQRALVANGRWKEPIIKLNSSADPLLCISRELRNIEVHIVSSTVAHERRKLLWGQHDKPEEATSVNWAVHWIDNLSLSNFQKLKFYSNYEQTAFESALKWFDAAQRDWGIVELLYRTISIYADELASHG